MANERNALVEFIHLATRRNTVKVAFRMALVVGLILNIINNFNSFVTLSFNKINLI